MRAVSKDFQKMVEGYGLTTLWVVYHRLDYPSLVQTMTYQQYDLYPSFPHMTSIVARIRSQTRVRGALVGHSRLIKPAEVSAIDTEIRIH
jgi:uncharacterized protein Usg